MFGAAIGGASKGELLFDQYKSFDGLWIEPCTA